MTWRFWHFGIVVAVAVMVLALLPHQAQAQDKTSITTPEIVLASTNFSCMEWRISGICYWLHCGITGCSIRASVRVSHFNPALVVTSYDALGESPWVEIKALYGPAQVAANDLQYSIMGVAPAPPQGSGRFAEKVRPETHHKNTTFKDAEVVGSPGNAATLAATLGLPIFCPMTDVAPLFPYFLSGLDTLAWRSALTEVIYAATWVPGLKEIGSWPLNTWGSIHPRNGFVTASEDPKGGAVIAHRAADIATRIGQPHIYVPVGAVPGWPSNGMKVWEPDPPEPNDEASAKWQMLVPTTQDSCEVFGQPDTFNIFSPWASGKVSETNDYLWNLWRPYSCCEDRGSFLFDVTW